jgi:hypothetical protein
MNVTPSNPSASTQAGLTNSVAVRLRHGGLQMQAPLTGTACTSYPCDESRSQLINGLGIAAFREPT